MGTLITTSIMIKLLLTSSLLALTAAEADPQVLSYAAPLAYGAAGVPYVGATVGAVAHSPVVKSDVITPAEVDHEVTAHTVPVAVGYRGLGPFGYYGKRSADAEPEADADAYYGYYGYGYGYLPYGAYRGYYGHPYAYYGKRSADAEPAVLGGGSRVLTPPTPLIHNPPVLPSVTYAAHPLGYAVPYTGLHYASLPVVAPAAPAAAEAVVAERKKREADPQVLLNAALPYAAPLLAPVGAVAHAPVVKSVVDSPAEVSHEVTAHTVPVAVGYHGLPYWG